MRIKLRLILFYIIVGLLINSCISSIFFSDSISKNLGNFNKVTTNPKNKKIRIGYFSADFHNHPTMHLMAELFELHDRNNFEIFAFSFGPDRQDNGEKG